LHEVENPEHPVRRKEIGSLECGFLQERFCRDGRPRVDGSIRWRIGAGGNEKMTGGGAKWGCGGRAGVVSW
jgi:hypothetical protein